MPTAVNTTGLRSCGEKATRWTRELLKPSKPVSTEADQSAMGTKETWTLGAGALMLVTGIILALTWNQIIENQVNNELILSPTSKTYVAWIKTRVPVHMRFYFWNWTNPDELRAPGFKPVLQEVGPYTYREITEKVDVVWNANGTVTYRKKRRWYFVPEESNGTEDDAVTTLNVVAKSAAYITRHSNMMTRMGLNVAISSTQTFEVTKTIGELLFAGYKNTLIDTARNLPMLTNVNMPFDRFGWFYKRNGSVENDGVFNIETGINGMESFGQIRSWNYKKYTPFFQDECGAVRGSGGEFFPPKRTKEDIVEFFSPDLCRYVTFRYRREQVVRGVTGYRYEISPSLFDNGEGDSENACFCSGECAPPGALNVSNCRFGAPGFVSFPNFYLADSIYRDNVVGMKPNPERHESHITLEPTYGIPLEVAARFQINVYVQPYNDLTMYKGLTPIYFPIMWFEQTAKIPDETVNTIKTLLLLPTIGMSAAAILMVIGTALICTALALRYCRSKRKVAINSAKNGVQEPMLHENATEIRNGEIKSIRLNTKL